jgi:hypothetical protein
MHISDTKNYIRNLAENLIRSSGSGFGRFQKSDPDPVKNCPDPQHCSKDINNTYEVAVTIVA